MSGAAMLIRPLTTSSGFGADTASSGTLIPSRYYEEVVVSPAHVEEGGAGRGEREMTASLRK